MIDEQEIMTSWTSLCIELLQVKEHSITGVLKYGMTWMIN